MRIPGFTYAPDPIYEEANRVNICEKEQTTLLGDRAHQKLKKVAIVVTIITIVFFMGDFPEKSEVLGVAVLCTVVAVFLKCGYEIERRGLARSLLKYSKTNHELIRRELAKPLAYRLF